MQTEGLSPPLHKFREVSWRLARSAIRAFERLGLTRRVHDLAFEAERAVAENHSGDRGDAGADTGDDDVIAARHQLGCHIGFVGAARIGPAGAAMRILPA